MNGGYSELNKRVRQMKQNGTIVIDRDDLAEHVDLSEVDRESLETMCKNAMASVVLYQNGFRSVVWGKGVYVDYVKIQDKQVLHKLIQNASENEQPKLEITAILRCLESKLTNDLTDEEDKQMAFTEDGTLFEEMTKRELVEILREIAGETA